MSLKKLLTLTLLFVTINAFGGAQIMVRVDCRFNNETWKEDYHQETFNDEKTCKRIPSMMELIYELTSRSQVTLYQLNHLYEPRYVTRLKFIKGIAQYPPRSSILGVYAVITQLNQPKTPANIEQEIKEAALSYFQKLGDPGIEELLYMFDEDFKEHIGILGNVVQMILDLDQNRKTELLEILAKNWEIIQESDDSNIYTFFKVAVSFIKNNFTTEESLYQEIMRDFVIQHLSKNLANSNINHYDSDFIFYILKEFLNSSPKNKELVKIAFDNFIDLIPGDITHYHGHIDFYNEHFKTDALNKLNDKSVSIIHDSNGIIDEKVYINFVSLFINTCERSSGSYNRTGQELLNLIEYVQNNGQGARKSDLLNVLNKNLNNTCGQLLQSEEIKSMHPILVQRITERYDSKYLDTRLPVDLTSLSALRRSIPLSSEAQQTVWDHLQNLLNPSDGDINFFCPHSFKSTENGEKYLLETADLLKQSGFSPEKSFPIKQTRCQSSYLGDFISKMDRKSQLKKATVSSLTKICSTFPGFKFKSKKKKTGCKKEMCTVSFEGVCQKK